jgi:hypothetical protein
MSVENARAKLMSGKILVWLLATFLLGTVHAQAQQPPKIPRIGVLGGSSSDESPRRLEPDQRFMLPVYTPPASALAKTSGGIVNPICFAALR